MVSCDKTDEDESARRRPALPFGQWSMPGLEVDSREEQCLSPGFPKDLARPQVVPIGAQRALAPATPHWAIISGL